MDYPANSQKAKLVPPEPKKIERVVEGEVLRRKKPLGKRFKEFFIAGDANSVLHYVVFDILAPAAKDAIADSVSQGVEKMIFGEARSSGRRVGHRPGGSNGYVSYNKFGPNNTTIRREEPRTNISRKARASHDFDEIILPTRAEAEEVIDRLFDLLARYESATVSDLYELVGVTGNYTDEKYGWVDIRGAGVTRVSGGYLLDLPKPELLDAR